jgi:chorismate mutase
MDILIPYRQKIDTLDKAIVELLVQRFDVVREVAAIKAQHGIPVVLEDRIRQVIDQAGEQAFEQAPPDSAEDVESMVREVYMMLIAICCDYEERLNTTKHSEE